MKNIILFFLFCVLAQHLHSQNIIIPTPTSYEVTTSNFVFDNSHSLDIRIKGGEIPSSVYQFQSFLEKQGFSVHIFQEEVEIEVNKLIEIEYKRNFDPTIGVEGYELEVNENSILLRANQSAGIFNALQTLRQLIPLQSEKSNSYFEIEGCKIIDYPRFKWRGLMLDVSRHFFTVDEVKAYINKMAQYKFNVFHWHLTDDQGWRIEIKSYPKLTEVGAWRVERHGRFGDDRPFPEEDEEAGYGGFYTQEQIKDIVSYAADRNITIVPEIDIPGHSMAALAAYPELSTQKEPKFVMPGSKFVEWYKGGRFKMLIENTLNPADENVYAFIDSVFTEVSALFPGEYIHMGGDEAYHGYWDEDESVQAFMKENDIEDSHGLQSYFVTRVEKIINSKGKKMIGWDEILEGGLTAGAAVMSWRGMKGGIEAAKMEHEVVMSPTTYAYLDYSQGDISVENRIYASLSLEKAYTFDPLPEGIDPRFILGGQGNLWTEVIPTLQYAFYMTYPRAFALSESLWSPVKKKNWNNFIERTEIHFDRFGSKHINISKAVFDPIITVYYDDEKLMCKLENSIPNSVIYYTIDNTYPVQFGEKYSAPFEIPNGNLSLRAQTFRDGEPLGRQLQLHRDELEKRTGH